MSAQVALVLVEQTLWALMSMHERRQAREDNTS
jgi:hypothetical protein